MKSALLLLSSALFNTAAAQGPAGKATEPLPGIAESAVVEPPAATVNAEIVNSAPSRVRLPKVEFQDVKLSEIVSYLKVKQDEAGGDAALTNIILTKGLEDVQVPAISLRNVTVTEVLNITTALLGLEIEPIMSDDSPAPVAWIVRQKAASSSSKRRNGFGETKAAGSAMPGGDADPSAGFSGAGDELRVPREPQLSAPEAPRLPNVAVPLPPGADEPIPVLPQVVELASNFGGAGMAQRAATPAARVFGIAPLIASEAADPDTRTLMRDEKLKHLIESLRVLAGEQDKMADVRAYEDMEIVVVKSHDPAAIALVAEAIEAMKQNINAAQSGSQIQASVREQQLKVEIEALRAKLELERAERESLERRRASGSEKPSAR